MSQRSVRSRPSTDGIMWQMTYGFMARTPLHSPSRNARVHAQARLSLGSALDDDCRAVAEHFRGRAPLAAHRRRLVAQPHHGIRAPLLRVLDQQIVRLLARLLAHLGVRADLAAD